jgi:hypothetical protein
MAGSVQVHLMGCIQVGVLGARVQYRGCKPCIRLGSNNTNAIFAGSARALRSSGVTTAIAATPTTTFSATNTPIGVAHAGSVMLTEPREHLPFANHLVSECNDGVVVTPDVQVLRL